MALAPTSRDSWPHCYTRLFTLALRAPHRKANVGGLLEKLRRATYSRFIFGRQLPALEPQRPPRVIFSAYALALYTKSSGPSKSATATYVGKVLSYRALAD